MTEIISIIDIIYRLYLSLTGDISFSNFLTKLRILDLCKVGRITWVELKDGICIISFTLKIWEKLMQS